MTTATTKPTAFDVAAYILNRKARTLTTWELQKLVYYVQAWHLAMNGFALFDERIEAWKDGPVVRDLFFGHSGRKHVAAGEISGCADALDDRTKNFVTRVLNAYRHLTPDDLHALTHAERPWVEARGDLPEGAHGSEEITPEALREFYSGLPSPEVVAADYSVSKRFDRTLRRLAE